MQATYIEKSLDSATQIRITITGRKSGRMFSVPVWFVRHGELAYLLPVGGASSQWYKNLLKTPTMGVAARRSNYTGRATPITDVAIVNGIIEEFRAKYGSREVEKYYSTTNAAVEVSPV
jgi:deazaflavin-dependent oxidoreductase (nitroreductase family)